MASNTICVNLKVTASAWVKDFREQIERTRILRTVYRSATALSGQLQSLASFSRATLPYSTLMVTRAAQTGAAGAGMIWRPVSSGTQVIMPGNSLHTGVPGYSSLSILSLNQMV